MTSVKDDISIEGEWAVTLKGEHFLLSSDECENKIIIFATNKMLERLSTASVMYMDGIAALTLITIISMAEHTYFQISKKISVLHH